jgi:N-acetylglucosamine-6-sulfatase
MPFVIRWPGRIQPGGRCEKLIQNIDYAPTFLDAAGQKIPDAVQGRSLLPLFNDPKSNDWREAVYYHYYEHGGEHQVPRHEGVRNARYKLINFYSNDGYNLFDLQIDPNELSDVAANPKYSAVMKSMIAELNRLRARYDVPELTAASAN